MDPSTHRARLRYRLLRVELGQLVAETRALRQEADALLARAIGGKASTVKGTRADEAPAARAPKKTRL